MPALTKSATRSHQSCWINQGIIASEYRDHPIIVFQSYLLRFGVWMVCFLEVQSYLLQTQGVWKPRDLPTTQPDFQGRKSSGSTPSTSGPSVAGKPLEGKVVGGCGMIFFGGKGGGMFFSIPSKAHMFLDYTPPKTKMAGWRITMFFTWTLPSRILISSSDPCGLSVERLSTSLKPHETA